MVWGADAACQPWRRLWTQLSGVSVGRGCAIGPAAEVALSREPARRGRLILEAGSKIGRGVLLHPYGGEIRIGRHAYVGPYTVIYGHGGVEIGPDALISMHCRILSSNHSLPGPEGWIRAEPDLPAATRIGSDVWLGAGVTVLAGVTVGNGCVVGAGAVVTRDLPPYAIAVGIPAVVKGSRNGRGPAPS